MIHWHFNNSVIIPVRINKDITYTYEVLKIYWYSFYDVKHSWYMLFCHWFLNIGLMPKTRMEQTKKSWAINMENQNEYFLMGQGSVLGWALKEGEGRGTKWPSPWSRPTLWYFHYECQRSLPLWVSQPYRPIDRAPLSHTGTVAL